ncbi:MAG: type II secretion system protein [bacterium]
MKTFKAFTIVELLVVMAVIGILLALAVFGIQALQKSQRETQRAQDLKNIQGELESYYSKYRRYPVSSDIGELWKTDTDFTLSNNLLGKLFSTIPIQSLTPTIRPSVYNSGVCDTNVATADSWTVGYGTEVGVQSPQEYSLFACTENGKSDNLGSKYDGTVSD